MNNENIFTKNFRDAQNQSPRLLTDEERTNPSFQGVRGKMHEGYGNQQNTIGLTALSALTSFLDPVVLPFLLGGAIALRKKRFDSEPTIIIDREKIQNNFEELQKLPELPTPEEMSSGKFPQLQQMGTPIEFVQGGRRQL